MAISIHQVALAVSYLPELGNLASATIAVNVGYLGLQRFRYREQMRACATTEIVPLGVRGTPKSIINSTQYKDLVYLAHLTDNDGLDDVKKRMQPNGHAPSAGWAFWYGAIFAHHQDRFVSIVITAISIFILVCGSAAGINVWSCLNFLGVGWWLVWCFWILVAGFFLPAILIFIGRWAVRVGCHHAVDCGKQCAELLKDMAPTDVTETVVQISRADSKTRD